MVAGDLIPPKTNRTRRAIVVLVEDPCTVDPPKLLTAFEKKKNILREPIAEASRVASFVKEIKKKWLTKLGLEPLTAAFSLL